MSVRVFTMEMEIAFWAVGAFVFGFVCVLGCSFADFVLGSLEDRG